MIPDLLRCNEIDIRVFCDNRLMSYSCKRSDRMFDDDPHILFRLNFSRGRFVCPESSLLGRDIQPSLKKHFIFLCLTKTIFTKILAKHLDGLGNPHTGFHAKHEPGKLFEVVKHRKDHTTVPI